MSNSVRRIIGFLCFYALSFAFSSKPPLLFSQNQSKNPISQVERNGKYFDDVANVQRRFLWRTRIGNVSIGPVIDNQKILVGTITPFSTKSPREAVLKCFDQKNGELLWQAMHTRLPIRENDLPGQPIASRPFVENDKVYYISNRGELLCVDIEGFRDKENDSPFREEKEITDSSVDIVWKLDMIKELGIYKRDLNDAPGNPISSPIVVNDILYCVTGNGNQFPLRGITQIPKPNAASFLAVNKNTGKIVWTSSAPGRKIIYGQWSSPVYAKVDGKGEIIFPGGDGCLYSFEPKTGRLNWKFDCNEKGRTNWENGVQGTRGYCVGSPTVHRNVLYIGLNQIDGHSKDVKYPLYAIDLRNVKKIGQKAVVWKFQHKDFPGTLSAAVVVGDMIYLQSDSGALFALDRATGKEQWHATFPDIGSSRFGAISINEKYILTATNDEVYIFQEGKKKLLVARIGFEGLIRGRPVLYQKVLYVTTDSFLWALPLKIDQ